MQKCFFILALMAGMLQAPAQQKLSDSVTEKLHTAIAGFQANQHCPGLAVAVVKDNEIIYSHALGYSNLTNKTPVTIDTRFPIMSVTKPFTATMLVQLAERGVLSIHDRVNKYVPEYKVRSAFPGPVTTTLYQLATHASGLPRNTPADITLARSFDRWRLTGGKEHLQRFSTDQELLSNLQHIQLDYPAYDFGERHYSNLGYSVLGIALQRAAKTGFANYIVNNICKPLQMTGSGLLTETSIHTSIAKGYRYNHGSYIELPDFIPNSALYAGGMYSTARDMCKFLSFQYEQKQSMVLSIESRAMMHSLGIGWRPAHSYVIHEGAIPGYRCIIAFNPHAKWGWVILTNGNDVDFDSINNIIDQALAAVYNKKTSAAISRYAGTYQLPQNLGSMNISVKNDSLYSTYLHDLLPGKPLIPEGRNRFHVEGIDGHNIGYEFMTDEQGQINRLRLGQLTWYKQ